MAEAKRDYYEVLGVSKDVDDATSEESISERLRRNTIRI